MRYSGFLTLLIVVTVFCDDNISIYNAKIRFTTDTNDFVARNVRNLKYIDNTVVNGSQLKILSASMPVLYEGTFRDMDNLKMLQLPSLHIDSIQPRAFKNLPNLDRIQLQDNNISEITVGVFNFMSISQLFLHRNKIRYIESGAFDDMPNLHTIKLNSNQIEKWDDNWFANTPKLSEVYIRRNNIAFLQQNAFRNIKKLQVGHDEDENSTSIYLSRNKISTIHPSALSALVRLNNFYLDRNKLEDIPDALFFRIESIVHLDLKKNKLKNIPKNMFSTTNILHTLDLTGNQLECIPVEIATKARTILIQENKVDCNCKKLLTDAIVKKGTGNDLQAGDCRIYEIEKQEEEAMENEEEEIDEEEEEE